jgi:hypothetical protein
METTMTDLVRRDDIQTAELLSQSTLVPEAFRGKPANVFLAVSLGEAVGLSPAVALAEVSVVNGRPSLSAQAMAALVQRAGHRLRVSGDDTEAVAQVIRSDDPEHVHEARFTLADAERAGLTKSATYQRYPAAMLRARATTAVIRLAAPDVVLGVGYDPAEVDAPMVDPAPPVLTAEVVGPPKVDPEQLLELADGASTPAEVKEIWSAAAEAGLLDVVVHGESVRHWLTARGLDLRDDEQ